MEQDKCRTIGGGEITAIFNSLGRLSYCNELHSQFAAEFGSAGLTSLMFGQAVSRFEFPQRSFYLQRSYLAFVFFVNSIKSRLPRWPPFGSMCLSFHTKPEEHPYLKSAGPRTIRFLRSEA